MANSRQGIALTLNGGTHVIATHSQALQQWLESYADRAVSAGWRVVLHTSETQQVSYSQESLQNAIGRSARQSVPFLLVTVEDAEHRPVSTVTWWPALPLPGGTSMIKFETTVRPRSDSGVEEWLRLAVDLASVAGAAQGAVRSPAMPAEHQYVMTSLERQGVSLGPNGLQRYLRQPGWAIWLTEVHVEVLGGRQRVRHEAPVHSVLDRDQGLWLELTHDPLHIPADTWAAFENYLAPLLPSESEVRRLDPPQRRTLPEDRPTLEDNYDGYSGAMLAADWGTVAEDSLTIQVRLSRVPSVQVARALNRAMLAWYEAGVHETYPGGGFHDLQGPYWEGAQASWTVDIGFAEARAATSDLLRRLAGWSTKWKTRVRSVHFE